MLGILQISIAGFAFGFVGVFSRLAERNNLSLGELLTFRFLVASALLFVVLSIFSPSRLKISFRELIGCAGLGIFGYAVFATLYFISINGTSIALASLLLYTYPVIVSLGAHFFFRERLTKAQWIALPVAAIGLSILLGLFDGFQSRTALPAIFAGLGSAFCYALYILTSSKIQRGIDPIKSGVYIMLFAGLGLFAANRPDLVASYNFNQVMIILGIAVCGTILPMILFLAGLQKLGNTQTSLLSTVEPITASVVGSLVMNEKMALNEWIGGAIVLVALVITILGGRRHG